MYTSCYCKHPFERHMCPQKALSYFAGASCKPQQRQVSCCCVLWCRTPQHAQHSTITPCAAAVARQLLPRTSNTLQHRGCCMQYGMLPPAAACCRCAVAASAAAAGLLLASLVLRVVYHDAGALVGQLHTTQAETTATAAGHGEHMAQPSR